MGASRFSMRLLALAAAAATLAGCRVEMTVPPGGMVVSESGAYQCQAGHTCSIDVVDAYFNETFRAVPAPDNTFMGWASGRNALCGGQQKPCVLNSAGAAGNPQLAPLLESDEVFTLNPVFLQNPRLGRDDLTGNGQPLPAQGAVSLQGSLGFSPGASAGQMMTGADIDLQFNAQGELTDMFGDATLPKQISDYIGVLGTARTQLGLYTGAQLNADQDINIHLIDERQYLLFYLFGGVDLEVGDRRGGSAVVSIDPPVGGSVIMIYDPADQMVYRYGSILGEARGKAESDQGLLPFAPLAGLPGPIPFYGHRYETGEKPVGIKVFDVLNFSGEFVVREPTFADVDLADPFNSSVGYFAGFNGHAEVAFGVLGFGLFSFDLAEASANFDVQPLQPLAKQRVSVYAKLAPDVSWQPDWFPILPETELQASFSGNAAGELNGKLAGSYHSQLPVAELDGSVKFDTQSVTMQARVANAEANFPISLTFRDGVTTASVDLGAPIGNYVRSRMDGAFDDVQGQIRQAQDDLAAAAEAYDFELSLRGLRQAIPGITSNAISQLHAVPDQVYSSVRSQVRSEINSRRYCALGVCTPSDSKRDSIANSAASSARSKAASEIAPYVDAMEELAYRASQPDDDSVREALRQALYGAYDHRHIDRTVSVTVSVDIFIKTISVSKSYRINRDVLTPSQAEDVLAAAGNVDRIPETSEQVVSAQAVLDRLPLDEALQAARDEVEAGLKHLPGLSSVDYTVSDGEYVGSVRFNDGTQYSVDFNVLDPVDLVAGVNRLAVQYVIDN